VIHRCHHRLTENAAQSCRLVNDDTYKSQQRRQHLHSHSCSGSALATAHTTRIGSFSTKTFLDTFLLAHKSRIVLKGATVMSCHDAWASEATQHTSPAGLYSAPKLLNLQKACAYASSHAGWLFRNNSRIGLTPSKRLRSSGIGCPLAVHCSTHCVAPKSSPSQYVLFSRYTCKFTDTFVMNHNFFVAFIIFYD
jgi:hypothetical protein